MSSQKVHVLIVEDESIVAMDLAAGLEQDGYHVVGMADNTAEAIDIFSSTEVDIVLMDVQIIGETDGIDTAAALLKIKYVPIIFLTAFTDQKTVERVKNICPAAFLSKPYSMANVRISIDLALSNFAIAHQPQTGGKLIALKELDIESSRKDKDTILQLHDHLFVKQNYRFVKLKIDEILYIESSNNYISIVTVSQKFSIRMQLSELLEKLFIKNIVRIHRSYAVNILAIQSFNDQEVVVGKTELPIGKMYKEDFWQQFNIR